MIVHLSGTLVEKQPTHIVMDVGGVGYEVFIPLSTFDRLPAADRPCRILAHDHVREDTHQLFGFMTEAERDLFKLLLTISGIGPRLALSALSGLSVRDIKVAIAEGDVKRLSSISGIGRKTAERMVMELKDKLSPAEVLEAVAGPAEAPAEQAMLRDAVLALVALGYKQDDARKMATEAVRAAAGAKLSVEDVIRRALSR